MPSILTIETVLPERRYSLAGVARAGSEWLADAPEAAKLFDRFLRSSETGDRYFAIDLSEVLQLRGLERRGALFEELGAPLGVRAVRGAISRGGLAASDIRALIFTSCTCPSIPSIDGLIIEQAGLERTVRRVPVYQHGCAGGVIGLELACELARVGAPVALTSVELCSLVFQPTDHRASQLVGSAIFADGAACTIVSPEDRGLVFIDQQSFLMPNSRHLMGYDIFDDGFHLRLDRELPQTLAAAAPDRVGEFLARHGLTPSDIAFWLFHPGGVKILDFLERSFALRPEQAEWSRSVLRSIGNLSSTTILFVLKAFLDSRVAEIGDRVLMMGIGPGLTIELILFEWVGG